MTKNTTALTAFACILIAALIITNATTSAETKSLKTLFTPTQEFNIPNQNATISFAFNGSYTSATLANNTWTFRDLELEHPQSYGPFDLSNVQSIGNLKFSAQNCNVTIWAYVSFYYNIPLDSLVYSVEGSGKQTANLGLNSTKPADSTEWSVIINDNIFLSENQGWKLLPDNTVIVDQAYSGCNVTLAHFELSTAEKSMVFTFQHSVTIITLVVLAVVVLSGVVIRVRIKRKVKAAK